MAAAYSPCPACGRAAVQLTAAFKCPACRSLMGSSGVLQLGPGALSSNTEEVPFIPPARRPKQPPPPPTGTRVNTKGEVQVVRASKLSLTNYDLGTAVLDEERPREIGFCIDLEAAARRPQSSSPSNPFDRTEGPDLLALLKGA